LLETLGVPTVVIGTDEFAELARLESRNRGLPGLPLALVPHPLGGIGKEEVLRKVDGAADVVARTLAKDASTSTEEPREMKP
jgi:hypothetical protein